MTIGEQAQTNPADFSLAPAPADMLESEGAKFLADVAFKDTATVIDLRMLRAILGCRTAKFDVRSARIIHGLDALVVLPGTKGATLL